MPGSALVHGQVEPGIGDITIKSDGECTGIAPVLGPAQGNIVVDVQNVRCRRKKGKSIGGATGRTESEIVAGKSERARAKTGLTNLVNSQTRNVIDRIKPRIPVEIQNI